MKKIKAGDEVIFLTGKEKGKVGKISRILEDRVFVSGLNTVKKHLKPNPNKGIEGGVLPQEASVHVSNVAIYNSDSKRADRVGIKISDTGEKLRFFKSSGDLIKKIEG